MVRLASTLLGLVVALAVLLPADATAATSWRITVTNLSRQTAEGAGQPLSPLLAVVHSRRVDLWSPGQRPSPELAAIAEDGQRTPFAQQVDANPGARRLDGLDAVIPPRGRLSFTVRVTRRTYRLTLLSMLANTNDGLFGVDSLPLRGRRTKRLRIRAWDAGSERNNERRAFIPGPCCENPFVRDPEDRRVRRHRGIAGRGDLSRSRYGWRGPIARVVARRLPPRRR